MDDHQNGSEIEPIPDRGNADVPRTPDNANSENSHHHTGDGASPGKVFIGGLARETTPAQFLKHFGKYGQITDSVIMKDRLTGQPRGFGFVTYADSAVVDRVIEESEQSVDDILANGNRIDFAGAQVEIKKAEPKKPNLPPPSSRRHINPRAAFGGPPPLGDAYSRYGGDFGGGDFFPASYRSGGGAYGGRASSYGGYGESEFGGYGGFGGPVAGGYGRFRPDPYSARFGGGLDRGYDLGGEYGGPVDGYAGYSGGGGAGYGGGYDGGFGSGYGGVGGGGGGSLYGNRGGYSGGGTGRHHPYGR